MQGLVFELFSVPAQFMCLESLLAAGKLAKGCRVIYAGSAAARGVKSLGMKAPKYKSRDADCITGHLDGKAYEGQKVLRVRKEHRCSLHVGHVPKAPRPVLSHRQPGQHEGHEPARTGSPVMRFFFKFIGGPIMTLMGNSHSLEVGAQRYMTGLFTDELKPSGKFFASAKGLTGKLTDQAEILDLFDDENFQDAAYEAIHRFMN